MSYKDFSQLNTAVSQFSLDPSLSILRRIDAEITEMANMAKALPIDWARAYAGVMVLKYASDGTPTDVTDSVTLNGVQAPNSLISDIKRRFYTIYNDYKKDLQAFDSLYNVSVGVSMPDLLPTIDFSRDIEFVTLKLATNHNFTIGHDSDGYYCIFNVTSIPSTVINDDCRGSFSFVASSVAYTIYVNINAKFNNNNRTNISGTVTVTPGSSSSNINLNLTIRNMNGVGILDSSVHGSVANGSKQYVSLNTSVSGQDNLLAVYYTEKPVNISDIIMVNNGAVENLKSAIVAL